MYSSSTITGGARRAMDSEDAGDAPSWYVIEFPDAPPFYEKVRLSRGWPNLAAGEQVVFGPTTREHARTFADELPHVFEHHDQTEPVLDPSDSDRFADRLKGQTTMHANPPRFEDEGQSGG